MKRAYIFSFSIAALGFGALAAVAYATCNQYPNSRIALI